MGHATGTATYKLFHNLTAPDKPSEVEYDSLLKLMADYVAPKPTVTVEHYRFHSRTQLPVAEFVVEYVVRANIASSVHLERRCYETALCAE